MGNPQHAPPPADHPPQLDIMVVGAHPDDVEIACGGSLAPVGPAGLPGRHRRFDRRRADAWLRWSGGAVARKPDKPPSCWECGSGPRWTCPIAGCLTRFEARVALATEFRKHRPKVVIGFGDKTPLASPDHWQAMQITDAAVFYSRLTKWDEHFAGWPPHRITAQLYFRLAFEPVFAGSLSHHFTVDISETLELKMAAIQCYGTQFPPARRHVLERIRSAAQSVGAACGFAAGEAFASVRPIGVQDVMRLLFAT